MSERCLSELALEQHLARAAGAGAEAHLATCPRCSARLQEMQREGDEFRQFVYPRTLDAVVERGAGKPAWRRWLWLAAAPVLAAAALLVVARPQVPADDYSGTKGASLALAIYSAGAGGARAVDDGAAVQASAALRFRVRPSAACHLWIVSLDTAGQVSRIFPAQGEGGALVSGPSELPGGAVLDGHVGLERFFAICSKSPVPFAAVESSAKAAAAGGAQALRSVQALTGLPEQTTQASVLIEKTP